MGHLEIKEEKNRQKKKKKKDHRMEVSKENDLSPVGLKRPKGKLRRPRRFFPKCCNLARQVARQIPS